MNIWNESETHSGKLKSKQMKEENLHNKDSGNQLKKPEKVYPLIRSNNKVIPIEDEEKPNSSIEGEKISKEVLKKNKLGCTIS